MYVLYARGDGKQLDIVVVVVVINMRDDDIKRGARTEFAIQIASARPR